jgi:hypothetical protein
LPPPDRCGRMRPRRGEIGAIGRAPDFDLALRAAADRADVTAERRAGTLGRAGRTEWAAHRHSVARRGRRVNQSWRRRHTRCGIRATRPLPVTGDVTGVIGPETPASLNLHRPSAESTRQTRTFSSIQASKTAKATHSVVGAEDCRWLDTSPASP